jgi:hypothetical protein
MGFRVWVTDKTDKLIGETEGEPANLDALIENVMAKVTAHIKGKLFAGSPDDLEQPLTVRWGDPDA